MNRQGVLPDGHHLALFETTQSGLRRVCQLPFSSLDHVVTSTGGWIAGVSGTDTRSVICWNAKTMAELTLPLPSKYFPVAVTFVGQILYIGGRIEEGLPFLGLYDLGAQLPQWNSVQIPREVVGWGKSVDALLVDGLRLLAFDNIVTPCWLLVFDISEPLQPKLSAVERLEEHGAYEHVSGVSAGHQWIAVLTKTTSGWGGLAQHIALLDKSSLKERAVISAHKWYRPEDPYDWSDIALWDDLLLVAAGRDGVGILDLSKIDDLKLGSEICRKEFCCLSLPSFHDEKVLRIIPAAFADYLGVVLEQDGSIRSLVLSRQDLLDIQNDTKRVPFEAIDREPGTPSAP